MSSLDLPIVDLRDDASSDPARRAHFVTTLGEALEKWGFVGVTGHGVPPELIARAYRTAEAFFAQPVDAKTPLEFPEIGRQRGYTGFGVERAKDTPVPDIKEFWQVGRTLGADHPLVASGGMPDNIWPEHPPEFAEVFGELFERIDAFAMRLLRGIGLHVGLGEHALIDGARDGNSVQRIIHYPPISGDVPAGAVRAAANEDINLLTVLPPSTQPGLELLDRDGTWLSLSVPADVMICDTGDIMQRLTGGRIPATTHRVVNPPGSANVSRFSMPFFAHPRPDWVIQPQQGDEPPMTAGEFLRQRLIANGVLPA